MIGLPAGTRICIAAGVTDRRSGFNGLAARVQTALDEDPFSGHMFVFRGRRGDKIKVLWWSGDGLCLLAKRLERGRVVWPQAPSGTAVDAARRHRQAAAGAHMATIIGLVNVGALASTRPMLNLANLPNDIDALKALLLAQQQVVAGLTEQLNTRDVEIEHLKLQIAKLRRMQFGRKSE